MKRNLFIPGLFLVVCHLINGQTAYKKLEEIRIRDPFILVDKATSNYYLYASMSESTACGKKGVQAYKSRDLETWEGPFPVCILPDDFWAKESVCCPETKIR